MERAIQAEASDGAWDAGWTALCDGGTAGDSDGEAVVAVVIDAATRARCARLAAAWQVQASDVAWSAWAVVLARYLTSSGLSLAAPRRGEGAGRDAPVAVRLDAGPDVALATLAGRLAARERAGVAGAADVDAIADSDTAPAATGGPRAGVRATIGHPDGDAAPGAADRCAWHPGWKDIDLLLTLGDRTDGGWRASLRASGGVAPARLQTLLDCLPAALDGLVETPDATVSQLSLVGAAARARLLSYGQGSVRAFPHDRGIHQLFEAQAARTPGAVALVQGDTVLDYRALDAAANRLARRLQATGVGPGERVALCVDRGVAMVVGMLAVLKAGGAYVPLDPAYPRDRLHYMLDDCAPVAAVVAPHLAPLLAGRIEGLALLDPSDGDGTADAAVGETGDTRGDPGPPSDGPGPDDVAYVVYTSGSTGLPKGVAIGHRGLCNLVLAQIDGFGVDAGSRVLQFASFSFDACVSEVMMALCSGASLHLLPAGAVVAGNDLVAALRGQAISHVTLPPAVLAALPDPAALATVSTLIVAGEALPGPLARRWARGRTLINAYGPSECTVCATMHVVDPDADGDPPIGAPIANTRLYLLDAQGALVPPGAVGEIHIGGAGVGRGYLHRDALTAQRFVPDPFDPTPGARMYRTGDLGRWNPRGEMCFLGRNDGQVKVRGFRIETGEIENVLLGDDAVLETAVQALPDGQGDLRLVAWVVPRDPGRAIDTAALRAHLARALPVHMLPAAFVVLAALPLTPNGKLDRRALPAPGRARQASAAAAVAPVGDVEAALCAAFSSLLDVEPLGRDDDFFAFGGNSLLATRLVQRLRPAVGEGAAPAGASALAALSTTLVFAHPTPAGLAAALVAPEAGIATTRLPRAQRGAAAARIGGRAGTGGSRDIAIVAMAGRFPGADSVEAFWDNLCAGRDSIRRFAAAELDPSIPAAERDDPDYVAARGIIADVAGFDAAFFGISPREAELMDPQHRIFLELCWECLERGGYAPDASDGPVGVFAGTNNGTYLQRHVAANPALAERLGAFQVVVANEKDYVATRVAHRLDLTGPAVSIHTACSTSLVAICQAVASLRAGQCDMALAGAASVTCPPNSGYRHQPGAMLSPDGHTRPFDADAGGTVFSDGAAVLLLKRLDEALADGDQVHAVIRGAAVNNDGGRRASFTAPSSDGQAAVIAMAQRDAGVDARSIGYVEAHGTATPLGDPIEIAGLVRAFRRDTADVGFCRVGSLKSNVGHLVAAAGAAGVIKAALALRERQVPGTAHFRLANPALALAGSPFVVDAALQPWDDTGKPRRAGVSSFGVGGTNAHVVLEEAPALPPSPNTPGPQLLVLSARSPAALAAAATALGEHLASRPGAALGDVAWTLARGRSAFAHRVAVVADSPVAAATRLCSLETRALIARGRPARAGEVVFLFPGQGAQYAGMGRRLHATEPAFRAAFDACAEALRGAGGIDLADVVFGGDADALRPTAVMQPALFAIEYALARLWIARDVTPTMLVGHSIGEFAAATIAGVFALPDAIALVARRGALMQAQPAGAMLSVRLPAVEVEARLPPMLSLAAENAPGACVIAGDADAVAGFRALLDGEGVACRPLQTSHAFHSAMMDPVVAPFAAAVAAVALAPPRIPIVSCATDALLTDAQATSPGYWSRHLRMPVRFASALGVALDAPGRVLLEVGPRTTLTGLARQRIARDALPATAIASMGDAPDAEPAALRAAVGQLWCRGVAVDPAGFDTRAFRRRVLLPTYPFERLRYWVDAAPADSAAARAADLHAGPAAALSTLSAGAPPVAMPLPMPVPDSSAPAAPCAVHAMPATAQGTQAPRVPRLLAQLRTLFEDAGFDMREADADANFMELGLDSLNLTQVALQLQKTFAVPITFRQLMAEHASLGRLAAHLDTSLPIDPVPAPPVAAFAPAPAAGSAQGAAAPFAGLALEAIAASAADGASSDPAPAPAAAGDGAHARLLQQVIAQQMQVMSQQLAMLAGQPAPVAAAPASVAAPSPSSSSGQAPIPPPPVPAQDVLPHAGPDVGCDADARDAASQVRYDVHTAFGAIARIHSAPLVVGPRQRERLAAFIARYNARTAKSKAYTQAHRAHMADPRVVSGFRPLYKELVYQTVVERSRGARLWDIDGNEYVDANNGFGMSLFGWQPPFVVDAVRAQLDAGYEIGPQHPLAGEVARLVCEATGHDRAALCNTGSEAVLGAIRIARTTTGRDTIAVFANAYHGIIDEVIVRGSRSLRAVPGAPGILCSACENVIVLEYGSDEALRVIRERGAELAAVLVEPVQSRRPDLQPVAFLRALREITAASGTVLVFDEVITGFRSHPGGAQALFGVRADLATYGKVVGGGYPLGVIAGKREFMDALDGGHWQYGDDSAPTVGVTYFAGTFVRHPLALAATHAVLTHLRDAGPALQEGLSARTAAFVDDLNAFCEDAGAPIRIVHFGSLWRTQFLEDHPLQELLFAMIRSRGVHILDNFPCFLTTAHDAADIATIARAYKDAVLELQESEFLPRHAATPRTVMDAAHPPRAGARIGRDAEGRPAWFVADDARPGGYRELAR